MARLLPILLALLCLAASTAAAQDSSMSQSPRERSWSLGMYGGMAFPYFTDFPTVDVPLHFTTGKPGLQIDLRLNKAIGGSSSSINASVGFSHLSGNFQDNGTAFVYLNTNDDTSEGLFRQHGTASLTLLTFGVGFSQRIISGLSIHLGPRIGYYLSGDYEQLLTIESPRIAVFAPQPGIEYRDSNRTEVLNMETSPKFSTYIGICVGLQYELPITTNFSISPAIQYAFALTSITRDAAWRVNVLELGLEAQFSL